MSRHFGIQSDTTWGIQRVVVVNRDKDIIAPYSTFSETILIISVQ